MHAAFVFYFVRIQQVNLFIFMINFEHIFVG